MTRLEEWIEGRKDNLYARSEIMVHQRPEDLELEQAVRIIVKMKESIFAAYEYFKGLDCSENCDPSVGFHIPECHITQDFDKILNMDPENTGVKI